jgi:hypothetical protein
MISATLTKDGMFSKTGRFTTEKFFVLRKKDEILQSISGEKASKAKKEEAEKRVESM